MTKKTTKTTKTETLEITKVMGITTKDLLSTWKAYNLERLEAEFEVVTCHEFAALFASQKPEQYAICAMLGDFDSPPELGDALNNQWHKSLPKVTKPKNGDILAAFLDEQPESASYVLLSYDEMKSRGMTKTARSTKNRGAFWTNGTSNMGPVMKAHGWERYAFKDDVGVVLRKVTA